MKKLIVNETQLVSLLNPNGKPYNDVYYKDGDFVVTNDRINKARETFYPFYKDRYNEDKNKIIHQLAFETTMEMIDNGKKIPEFGDYKIYHSITNMRFSPKQVEYVENQIRSKYENMNLEELYDYMLIKMERDAYDTKIKCRKAVSDLLNKGFFDDYLNGNLKELALWTLGKSNNVSNMLGWLYSRNRFTHKTNVESLKDEINKTKDEILNSDEKFMINPIFLALEEIASSIYKLNHPK